MDDAWLTHVIDAAGHPTELRDSEWLLTNGTGAYAMGTVAGVNTRRYHGLLVAAAAPPVGRVMALNQMWEQLVVGRGETSKVLEPCACAFLDEQGREVYAPRGQEMLLRFERGLSVRTSYEHELINFSRELFLHWKAQAATLVYLVEGLEQPATLRLAPMLTLRDFHGVLSREGTTFDVQVREANLTVSRLGVTVTLHCPGASIQAVEPHQQWWNQVFYPIDRRRGQEDHEDYFIPARLEIPLDPGPPREIRLTVALGDTPAEPVDHARDRTSHLAPIRQRLAWLAEPGNPEVSLPQVGKLPEMFAIATDDFVVDRVLQSERLSTIIAGYPWFADWGRDTFIALPGLLLTTGRFEEARAVLKAFAGMLHEGLVPNRFDDYKPGEAHYNTVDASLWFVHSAMQYVQFSGDQEAWADWLSLACRQVIEAYLKGTLNDIKAGGDGLISAGSRGTQLTWMDAACGEVIFTPRHGKAVEINALWYSNLAGLAQMLAETDASTANHYQKLIARIKRSFLNVFWDDALGHLYDHVAAGDDGQEVKAATLRPNQIFACSLPHSPLPRTKQARIVQAVTDKLLTPFGLRTLPIDDPNYHGRYQGDQYCRDEAYHQGTVWPWLIGPYAEAVMRVDQFSGKSRRRAMEAITPLLQFMAGQGVGQLNEIHEADAPYTPSGCIAQAWSVAEVLRVLQLMQGDHKA